jgi:ABC-type polysaccharide/polyol phosphate transport system ATPase subunit
VVLGQLRNLIRPDHDRPAIEVEDLTETFRLYHEKPGGLKERLYRFSRPSYTDFNALEHVSFTVEHGEAVGILGHNGSGKSTLLKVLARILPPDGGSVETNGRVASLLELGAGFHGDLTGRENIYLNGAILGLSRGELEEKFDEIVAFAGIRPFLDTAVRNYSSGMYVRLGFAIAVTVDPDILLVDEVLSVGDAEFQVRSLERMRRFREEGKTLLVVSHDLEAIQELCGRTIVLDRGRVVFDGNAREGVQLYSQLTASKRWDDANTEELARHGSVRIDEAHLTDRAGNPLESVSPGTKLLLRIKVTALDDVPACSIGASFERGDGTELYEVHTAWHGLGAGPLQRDQSTVVDVRFTANLLAGHYRVHPVVTDASVRFTWAFSPQPLGFEVKPARGGAGLVDLAASTAVQEGPALRLGSPSETGPIPIVRSEEGQDRGGAS